MLGIEQSQLIPASGNLYTCENLLTTTLINNYQIVQYDNKHDAYRKLWLPKFINNTYKNIARPQNEPTRNIYITRASAKYRKLSNESEIIEILEKHNYEIIDLDKISVAEQITTFGQAKKIIGIHGAGLANLFFASPKTKLLEIFPYGYYDSSYRLQALTLGLNYSYLIGEYRDCLCLPHERDIFLNAKKFQKVLEDF